MPLLSEVVGALFAGALVVLLAKQVSLSLRGAVGVVAVVPIAVAGVVAVPTLYNGGKTLREEHRVDAPLTDQEAQLQPGVVLGMNVGFLSWVDEQLPEGDSIHLEIGQIPDEVFVADVGVRQAAILQWSLFQLAPHLAVEQSPKARDLKPGEGRNADWLVFYEFDPGLYQGPIEEPITYAPGFAVARSSLAG